MVPFRVAWPWGGLIGNGTPMEFAIGLLALVLLYLGTKDRWRWKRILARMLVAALMIGAIGGAIAGYFEWKERKERNEQRLAPSTHLAGVDLGASEADVLFGMGQPEDRVDDRWIYAHNGGHIFIYFREGRVRSVLMLPLDGSYDGLRYLRKGSTMFAVEEELGRPDVVLEKTGGLVRGFCYPRLNSFFVCEKGKVEVFGIYDPALGKPPVLDSFQ